MPTYEYKCFSCGENFETFQKISDSPISSCPMCNSDNVKRLLSATAFHLKGSGWYKTDYGSSVSSPSSSASGSESKTETKETKSDSSSTTSKSDSNTSSSSTSSASSVGTSKNVESAS